MQCHGPERKLGATLIDPVSHGNHAEGSMGNNCVACHMPMTTYMQRDPRHDHGFHIPDPLLTKQLGIPNACQSCHDPDYDPLAAPIPIGTAPTLDNDTLIRAVDTWYGEKMVRPERRRTYAINAAYEGHGNWRELLQLMQGSIFPAWRATLLQLTLSNAYEPEVINAAIEEAEHSSPLVRTAAAQVLAAAGQNPKALETLRKLATDPVNSVKIAAAYGIMAEIRPGHPAYQAFIKNLAHNADQPLGAINQAHYAIINQKPKTAEKWYQKAIQWDPYSAGIHQEFAIFLSQQGRPDEAEEYLKNAAELEPENAYWSYLLALSAAEQGKLDMARRYFQQCLERDPQFSRAWYNLGLLYAQENDIEKAIDAIRMAERHSADNPDYPYALATVLMRDPSRIQEAVQALLRALEVSPNHGPSNQLMQSLQMPGTGTRFTLPESLEDSQ